MEFLRDKKLNNGVHLSFYNESRPVAGDRWHVVLKIVATMPLSDPMIAEIDSLQNSHYYQDKFNGNLSFDIERKKHFIDENLVGEALEELMSLAEKNLVEYVGHQSFADKLFLKQISELKNEYALQKLVEQNHRVADAVEEPEDFSACFK